MTDKTKIWDALAKTDPAQTKNFNRAGGFKGTAVKPAWILKRLTEEFGPAGIGWGVGQPSFETVHCGDEILVYCTVSAWHGNPENTLWGVGGDKVMTKRQSGPFCDDEAFKKAFTDALNNAFKSIGVAADIHLGLFDDDKYVSQAREEFAEPPAPLASAEAIATIRDLAARAAVPEAGVCKAAKVPVLEALPAHATDSIIKKLNLTIDANKTRTPVDAG